MASVDLNALYAAGNAEDNASKKTMVYESDAGVLYTVLVEEHIGEALGFADFTTSTVAAELPKGFRMRTITFSDASGKVRGQLSVGNPLAGLYAEGGTLTVARKGKATGVVCSVTGTQGEKRRFPQANDTGQQSGDNT